MSNRPGVVYGLGPRTHMLRLQGKGTPGSWPSVGESMAEAPPALPQGLSVLGASVFPRYFHYVHHSLQASGKENSCPYGTPSPRRGGTHLRIVPALCFESAQEVKTLNPGPPLAGLLTLGGVLRRVLLQGLRSLREAEALRSESRVEG